MENTDVTFEDGGNTMIIRVDLTKNFGKSSSGKSTIIASTHGFSNISPGAGFENVGISLNVIRK